MGMTRKLTILFVALSLVLGACGDDNTEAVTPAAEGTQRGEGSDGGGGGDAMPDPVCIGENEERLPEYEGLTPDQAQSLADDQGFTLREVGRDGECFAITMDLRSDRVNIEIASDVVIAAAIF